MDDIKIGMIKKVGPQKSPGVSPKVSPKTSAGAPPLPPWQQAPPKASPPDPQKAPHGAPANPNDWQDDEDEEPQYQPLNAYNDQPQVTEMDESLFINGIPLKTAQKLPIGSVKVPLAQCDTCGNCYAKSGPNTMISYEYMEGQPVCYHCMFWMNYTTRQSVDGVFGKTVMEYVIQCKDFHDKEKCTRNSNQGGCFLCDYKNGIPIENVLGSDVLLDMMLGESAIYQDDTPTKEPDDFHEEEFSFSIKI